MALVSKTRTYVTGNQLTAPNYNDDRDEVIAGVNDIDNAQVNAAAGIEESKLAFSASGHNHDGASGGKKVVVSTLDPTGLTASKFVRVNAGGSALETADLPLFNRGFLWHLNKTLIVENDAGVNPPITSTMTAIRLTGYVKLAPSGTSIILSVKKTSGVTVATLTIPTGQQSAQTTSMVVPTLSSGEFLRLDITQIGSTVAGQGLTVLLDCTSV